MKLDKVILKNFRSFYGTIDFMIDDFTVFIGKNDQGKSSIFEAIDIFINEGKGTVKIDENDLNQAAKNEGKESFKIGLSFRDIPEEAIIDATNPTSLKDEFLLNKDANLEIWKSFRKGKLQETLIKCLHPANDEFLKSLMQKKVSELQDFVKKNNINLSGLDGRKSADLRKAIRDFYKVKDGELKFEEIEIKIDEENLKDIWIKLQKYLPVYSLFHSDRKNIDQDDEIQDPLKAKIEQLFKKNEVQAKLNEIAKQIDAELKSLASSTVEKFNSLNKGTININITPNIPEVGSLKWKDVYKGIGFYTNDNIPLNKRGSGVRRLVLLSSFLAETERKKEETGGHIIYAIEEPETSLHPDLQIKFIETLLELSKTGNYQILISTHSPALIRLFEIGSIRYVKRQNIHTIVLNWSDEIAKEIVKDMGLLPNLGKVVICVEGSNDENFLRNINENIPELKRIINLNEKIDSGLISFIPLRGSNLIDWINRETLKNTNAIEFHLYDRDSDEKYKKYIEKVNKRGDGSCAYLTKKREIENYIPRRIIEQEFGIKLNLDQDNWDEEDIPRIILGKKKDMKENDIKSKLCGYCSKKITKEDLEEIKAWDEIKGWFEKIKEMCDKALATQ